MKETDIENKITETPPEEASPVEAAQPGTGAQPVEKMVPASDVDKIKSSLDKAHAHERKEWETRLADLETDLTTLKQERDVFENRATTAESMASDAQREVSLRNRARSIAAGFASSWGAPVARAAEEKLLKAESDRHLQALYYEFLHQDLPKLIGREEKEVVKESRVERAQTGLEAIGSHALPPEAEQKLSDIDAQIKELMSPEYRKAHPRENIWLKLQELKRQKREVGTQRRTKV